MKAILAFIILILALVPASADVVCSTTDGMLDALRVNDNEVPAFMATTANATALLITVSPEGTFSVLIQPAAHQLCVIMIGANWKVAPLPPALVPELKMRPLPNSRPGFSGMVFSVPIVLRE